SRQNKVPLHEALAHSRVMSPEQLRLAVRQQTVEVSLNALRMDSGTYRFEPQSQADADSVPDARTSPVALIVDAAKRFATPAESKKWLGARRDATLTRSPELDRELFTVRQAWPGEGVTAFAAAGRAVHEALSLERERELPLLHFLSRSCLVQLAGRQQAHPSPVASHETPAQLVRGK